MVRVKSALVWILRLALVGILTLDFLWTYSVLEAYRRGGVQGIRDHFSFSHLRFDVHARSPEELVHEAQKGYEVSALIAATLMLLTWIGLRAHKRVGTRDQQPGVPVESSTPSKRAPGG